MRTKGAATGRKALPAASTAGVTLENELAADAGTAPAQDSAWTPEKMHSPVSTSVAAVELPVEDNRTVARVVTLASEEDLLRLLSAGVPEGTRRAYTADRVGWVRWAERAGASVLPPHGDDLARWAAHLLTVGSTGVPRPRPLSASTVSRRLSAVSTWAVEQGHGRPDLRAARLVLRGHRRTEGGDRPSRAAPVTVNVLRALVAQAMSHVDAGGSPTARALRDRAVLLVGFGLGARRSELVALDLHDLRVTSDGLEVRVLRAKTREAPDPVGIPWASDPALCPVRAVRDYKAMLAVRWITEGPLLRPVTRTDVVLGRRLSAEAVADVVARLAEQAGLPVPEGWRGWSGHSLRRGMATEARRAGADALRIARQGGWADNSGSLAVYLADVDRWQDHPLSKVL